MRLTDETTNALYRTAAQKNLPVYPADNEVILPGTPQTDFTVRHAIPGMWTDAEHRDSPIHFSDAYLTDTELDRLTRGGTVRNRARRDVESDPETGSAHMLAFAILACIFAVGVGVGLMVACAFLWVRH